MRVPSRLGRVGDFTDDILYKRWVQLLPLPAHWPVVYPPRPRHAGYVVRCVDHRAQAPEVRCGLPDFHGPSSGCCFLLLFPSLSNEMRLHY